MATIIRAVIGYVFLVLTVRVLSRRPGGQLTMAEFVIVFLIGGVIILATMGDDRSMTNTTCAVIAIGLMHRLVSRLKSKFPRFGALVDGTPLVLIRDRQWKQEVFERAHIDSADVSAAARAKGVKSATQIRYAVLERNGSISIFK